METQLPSPKCPVCEVPVEEAGHFCDYPCWLHWHLVVEAGGEIVEVEKYVDMVDQPWYNGEAYEDEAWENRVI